MSVKVNLEVYNQDWENRLQKLGEFLSGYVPDWDVHIYAYEDENIGGLRINELDFSKGNVGSSFMCSDNSNRLVLARCEDFCSTYGLPPYKPEGWSSYLNEHGETKVNLLNAMGMVVEAKAEYQKQLVEEALLDATERSDNE